MDYMRTIKVESLGLAENTIDGKSDEPRPSAAYQMYGCSDATMTDVLIKNEKLGLVACSLELSSINLVMAVRPRECQGKKHRTVNAFRV